jgi:hypothetical protein
MLNRIVLIDLFKTCISQAQKKSENAYYGRCPICGDSKRDLTKKRFFLLLGKKPYKVYCHNCGFLKYADTFFKDNFHSKWLSVANLSNLFKPYVSKKSKENDLLESKLKNKGWKYSRDKFLAKHCFPLVSSLQSSYQTQIQNRALSYCNERRIPKEILPELFVVHSGEFQGRLLFPFINEEKEIYYFQARTLGDNTLRFLTKDFSEEIEYVFYRFFRVKQDDLVFICEGLIDCLFTTNGISTTGTAMGVEALHFLQAYIRHRLFVFDNDKPGKAKTKSLLQKGERCFIWPEEFRDFKDFGQMVQQDIEVTSDMITKNSFKGIQGITRLLK